MPNVSSINLGNLSANKSHSAVALLKLAQSANGPLRLQKKIEDGKTVIHLGVRSWPTYFFEKIVATEAEIAKAELKTQVAIECKVRSFLHSPGLTMGVDRESIVADLHLKVLGKSILPTPVSADEKKGKSSVAPNYIAPEIVQTTSKLFYGSGTVPTGLSVAAVSPLAIIADVRLVTERTYALKSIADERRGSIQALSDTPDFDKKAGVNDFKKYYLGKLNGIATFVQTSVVMELILDNKGNCSVANQEGARAAFKEFTAAQKNLGKHVSMMLTVSKLPAMEDKAQSMVRAKDTGAVKKSNQILMTATDYEKNDDEKSDDEKTY